MADITVSTDIDALMSSADNAAARTSLELGATDTVEFGAFIPPAGTTAEIDAVTTATVGQVMFDTDRGQSVRFTGAASYDVITSRVFTPTLYTTQGAALSLPASRLFESGFFADSPTITSAVDLLYVYSGKNPDDATSTAYLYHNGEQTTAGWYNNDDLGGGVITSDVFTPDTLIQFRLTSGRIPFIFGNYIINTTTPVTLSSESLQAGSTYRFDFDVNYLDLLGSNAPITVDYSGTLEAGGFLSFKNDNTESNVTLLDLTINSPENTTKVAMSSGAFSGVSGSNSGSWTVSGIITPSTDGALTVKVNQATASVDPLYYSTPTMTVTLLTD